MPPGEGVSREHSITIAAHSNNTLRKKVAISVGLLVFVVTLIHVVHAVTLDKTVEYIELRFSSPQVTPALDGYRVAFISDIHEMSAEDLQKVVDTLNTRNIDLLILGGDYSSDGSVPLELLELLSQVRTTDGIFAVEGNHDNRANLFAALEACGITPLKNSGLRLRDKLYLAGTTDYWSRDADIARATQAASPDDLVLLVTHNADVTMVQGTGGIDLILSGHTHGGQITFFGFFAPALLPKVITDNGQRFKSGWATSGDGTPVYVSNGVGRYQQVPRVFARPQVILITLTPSN